MRYIAPFDQVAKQHGVEVFLMRLDPQTPVKSSHLRKAACFTVFLESLLYEKAFPGGQGSIAVESLVIKKFPEREREQFMGTEPARASA